MKLDISRVFDFISPETITGMEKESLEAIQTLHQGTGAGSDYLVVVGIGGSYLGARAQHWRGLHA